MVIKHLFRNIFYFFILCLVVACNHSPKQTISLSQQVVADSLANYMRTTVNPLFVDHKITTSRAILDSLEPIVKQHDYYTLTCSWLRCMGVQYILEKKHDSALIYLRQSLHLATEKDTSLKHVIAAKTQLADLFIQKKKLDSALLYARESYYLAKKIDTSRLPMILLNLTSVYTAIGDMPTLRTYLFQVNF